MKLSFPHMGNLWVGLKAALEDLGQKVIVPPKPSKRTLDLGGLHGPEFACLPLKVNLGGFIEALEAGAEGILQAGGCGPCRFGYYGEVQREILQRLGYRFEMILLEPPGGNWRQFVAGLRRVTGNRPWLKVIGAIRFGLRKLSVLDDLERRAAWVRAREMRPGGADRVLASAIRRVDAAGTLREVDALGGQLREELSALEVDPTRQPLKVRIVGEIFVVLEPFVNHDLERQLGRLGVEAHRTLYISEWFGEHVLPNPFRRKASHAADQAAKPYLGHLVGGDGWESVGYAVISSRDGTDGVVHLNPFTCMPETVAQSILPKVSRELQIPVISFIIDEHTGTAGLLTRLEAFVDLMARRRHQRGVSAGAAAGGGD